MPECGRRHHAKGLCHAHYQREWHGRLDDSLIRRRGRPSKSLADRIEERTDRSAGPDACYIFTGSLTAKGYGRLRAGGKVLAAHRVAFELARGRIEEGMKVRHTCSNRACVRVSHLYLSDR